MDDHKAMGLDQLGLLQPGAGGPAEAPNPAKDLALLGGLAAAAMREGRSRISAAESAAMPLPPTAYLLDLSQIQYDALQQVGGTVMVVVNDQRLIIARTADAYTAYAANS